MGYGVPDVGSIWTWHFVEYLNNDCTVISGTGRRDSESDSSGLIDLMKFECAPVWCHQGYLDDTKQQLLATLAPEITRHHGL